MKRNSSNVAIIIPCHNGAGELKECLAALASADLDDVQCIVVDDGSTDDSAEVALAASLPLRLMRMGVRRGPAAARNAGARAATAGVLVFLDADVTVYPETIAAIRMAFAEDPELGALMGAYDDTPSAPGFYSQYRNLLHCYVHRTGARCASTFWTGCGAIRSHLFWAQGGFDETPGGVDDIEFGGRAVRVGIRIELRPDIQVKHRKAWTFMSTLRTDVALRAVPWTLLILRDKRMPNALSVDYRTRVSVASVWLAVFVSLVSAPLLLALLGALACVALALYANRKFYAFLRRCGGTSFALQGMAAHLLHLFVCGGSFLFGVVLFASGRRLSLPAAALNCSVVQEEMPARASGD